MEQVLLDRIKAFVGDRAWSSDLVLKAGVDLAQAVNSSAGLSGKQKCELVCQTILKVLDDAEKAEKEHLKESTDSEKTKVMIAKWEEYRNCVKTVLPVTLDLVISAARGQFDLKNVRTCASQLLCRSFSVELPVQLRQLLRLANALPALPAEVGAVLAPQVEKPEEKQPPLSQSLSPPAPTEVPPNAEPEPPKELDTQEEVQPAPPADQEKSESA